MGLQPSLHASYLPACCAMGSAACTALFGVRYPAIFRCPLLLLLLLLLVPVHVFSPLQQVQQAAGAAAGQTLHAAASNACLLLPSLLLLLLLLFSMSMTFLPCSKRSKPLELQLDSNELCLFAIWASRLIPGAACMRSMPALVTAATQYGPGTFKLNTTRLW
jgi:hypothetical protein